MESKISDAMAQSSRIFRGRLIVPHQTDGVRWMLGREVFDGAGVRGGLLADEMGLGKTASILATIAGNTQHRGTLIVCPKSLVAQWVNECTRFLGIHPAVISAAQMRTLRPMDLDFQYIIITTYSALLVNSPVLHAHEFGRIVLDEAHAIKNTSRKVHMSARNLKAGIRWCMTGTPVTRRKRDFMALMHFIGDTASDYKTLRDTYVMRRTFEDLSARCERLRLPPLELQLHVVEFESEEEKEAYTRLEDEFSWRLEAFEQEQSADNTMYHLIEVIMRMRQMTVHPQLVLNGREDPGTQWTAPVTKLNAVTKMVSELPRSSKVLIFTHWTYEMNAMCEAMGDGALKMNGATPHEKRNEIVTAFNTDPEVRVLVLHIDVGGAGLNLQAATHVIINSMDWNATSELQAIARAHRLGVEHPVVATRMVIKNTIDEYIYKVQQDKLKYAADVLNDDRIEKRLNASNGCALSLHELSALHEFIHKDS